MSATLRKWYVGAPNPALDQALERLCRTEDVVHVAVMPDAHVAEDVCVGTVTATNRRLLPAAVGSDIGCGMVSVGLHAAAERLHEAETAARVLGAFARVIPPLVHPSLAAQNLPNELDPSLSAPSLQTLARREGRLEFGTLGRGNHFLELQTDERGELWLAVHTGSRCMGPAIRHHHERLAQREAGGLAWLDAETNEGKAYLSDVAWARRFAELSRRRILERACEVLADLLHASPTLEAAIHTDHNHVRRELHQDRALWVHRKGAQRVGPDEPGIIPGSMGSSTYHVTGRANPDALDSAAHGAGRALSRSEARKRIRTRELEEQMRGVWFDSRLRSALREEAPRAYKDIGEVMRAQRDLVRIERRLEPVLVYKAV